MEAIHKSDYLTDIEVIFKAIIFLD